VNSPLGLALAARCLRGICPGRLATSAAVHCRALRSPGSIVVGTRGRGIGMLAIAFPAATSSFPRWRQPLAGVSAAKSPVAISAGWGVRLASFSPQGRRASSRELPRNIGPSLFRCVRSPPRSRIPPPSATRRRRGGAQGRSVTASTQSPPWLGLVDSFHVAPPEQARGYSASACHDRGSWEQSTHRPGVPRVAHPARHSAHASVCAGAYAVRRGCAHRPAQASGANCSSRRV
jgi:hypothetical protein